MSEVVPFIRIEKGETVRILCDELKAEVLENEGWMIEPVTLPRAPHKGKLVPMYRGLRYSFTKCFVDESQRDLLIGWATSLEQLPVQIEKAKPGPKPKVKTEDESIGTDS